MKKENIHERAKRVAGHYLSSEAELVSILQILDRSKEFVHLKYSSLSQYCRGHLKLSDDRAGDLVRVARKSREVPELKLALDAGKITLTNAKMLAPIINKENSGEWIAKAAASKRELEKEIKEAFPERVRAESLRFVGRDRLELRFEITAEEEKLLQRAVDVLSQKENKLVSRKDVFLRSMECFLEKHDPLRRAERSLSKMLKTPGPARVKPNASQLVHAVNSRDQGRCTHAFSDGERCTNTKFLDAHHIIPREFGGKDVLDNLTTLCRLHHRVLHREI